MSFLFFANAHNSEGLEEKPFKEGSGGGEVHPPFRKEFATRFDFRTKGLMKG